MFTVERSEAMLAFARNEARRAGVAMQHISGDMRTFALAVRTVLRLPVDPEPLFRRWLGSQTPLSCLKRLKYHRYVCYRTGSRRMPRLCCLGA